MAPPLRMRRLIEADVISQCICLTCIVHVLVYLRWLLVAEVNHDTLWQLTSDTIACYAV
jgi:hypothetical protein